MHIGFDDGAVLVSAVVIGGDAASAVVHAFTYGGVTKVGQVIRFSAISQSGIFDFYKVAYMHISTELRTWTQAGIRTYSGTFAYGDTLRFTVDVGERQYRRTIINDAVSNHTVGTNTHTGTQLHMAFKNTVDVYRHILFASQVATQVNTRWIDDANALRQQRMGLSGLVDAF